MNVYFCSLAVYFDQVVQPRTWTTVRFPYGGYESVDEWNMHRAQQGDVLSKYPDPRSALIYPEISGLGLVEGYFELEAGDYREVRSMFVRDPLSFNGNPNTTADEHHTPSPGKQYYNRLHMIAVNPDTPLAFEIWHNASSPKKVLYAQFKLGIVGRFAHPGA